MTPEWLPYANFSLNLLLLPLAKVLWDIRIELARINGRITAVEQRVDSIDRRHELSDNYNRGN